MKESLFSSGAEAANVQFYLFGSILKDNCRPNDIDILILYDDSSISNFDSVINLRKTLEERLMRIINLPIDITLLSYKENTEISFVSSENAEFFYSIFK